MKFLKRLVIFFLILIVAFICAGLALSFIYSDEVKQKIVGEINKNLKAEIAVADIRFSVLRKFPNASLEFKNILIRPVKQFNKRDFPGQKSDTLLYANSLFLEFNLRSLLSKYYKITSLHILDGKVNLMLDQKGMENFRFWESSGDSESDFKIDLQDVKVSNVSFFFSDLLNDISISSNINKLNLKGNFSAYQYNLAANSDFSIDSLSYEKLKINGPIPVLTSLELEVLGDLYKITKGYLQLGKMKFLTEGEYFAGGINRVDIGIVGEGLDLKYAGSFLSGEYLRFFEEYNPYGTMVFSARLQGRYGRNERPELKGDFALQDAGLSRRGVKTRLSHITMKGSFSNGRLRNPLSYLFDLESFSGKLGSSQFHGDMKVENLINPYLRGHFYFEGELSDLTDFYKPEDVESASGKMKVSLQVNGYLEKLAELTLESLPQSIPEVKMEISNGTFFLKEGPWQFESINGRMHLTRKLILDNFSFVNRGNSFVVSGELYSDGVYVFRKGAVLNLKGTVHSDYLNLDVLLPDPDARTDENKLLLFPEKLNTSVYFSCNEFIFRNFKATNISGNVSYKPRMFTLNSISFQTMDGRAAGGGAIIQKMNHDFLFQAQTSFQNINIRDLFYSFNDFGQTFITSRHLKGSLSGTLNFISEWNNDFEMIGEKIVADSRLQITGGELVNFEPMNALSGFIELEELKHIRFSNLQNEIFIRNQIVTIPAMDIQSSAFNITLSGTHNFNNQFTYRLRILLSDVLFTKARRAKRENEQYAVQDDGLGRTMLPLIITGTPDNFKVNYDRRAAAEIIRQGFEEERRTLRRILNEEFGWFSRDSVSRKTEEIQQRQPVYKIEWEEDDTIKTKQPASRPAEKTEPPKKQFQITWEEEELPDTTKRRKSF